MSGASGGAAHQVFKGHQWGGSFYPVVFVVGDYCQLQQNVCGNRAAAGLGVVQNIPGPYH